MTPSLASAIITAFSELIRLAPQLIVDVQRILDKVDPTAEDWDALKAKIAGKSYFDYVKDSDLPKPPPS